jgi:hypothetical protein
MQLMLLYLYRFNIGDYERENIDLGEITKECFYSG